LIPEKPGGTVPGMPVGAGGIFGSRGKSFTFPGKLTNSAEIQQSMSFEVMILTQALSSLRLNT
jgi:hypothetical protein